jgi:toxin YoeB
MFNPKYEKRFEREYYKLCRKNSEMARKIERLIADILEHPTTGLGRPERLKHMGGNGYSREIDKKNRLVYRVISSDEVRFESCEGHYDDH